LGTLDGGLVIAPDGTNELPERPAIGHHQGMSGLIWMVLGGVVAVVSLCAWALARRGGDGDGPDLGTISGQWMAERRMHEREAGDR
jgi:hypothetical protein